LLGILINLEFFRKQFKNIFNFS